MGDRLSTRTRHAPDEVSAIDDLEGVVVGEERAVHEPEGTEASIEDGTFTVIESIGMPAAGIRAPLSAEQLDELARTLDNPSSNLDVSD